MFYIYLHSRNDTGEVFYIGKGSKRRAWSHKNRNPHWKHIVDKHGYQVAIHSHQDTESESFDAEKLLISEYRKNGAKIVNMTDGGDGVSGCKRNTAQRKANSDLHKAIAATPEGMAQIMRAARSLYNKPESVALAISKRTATMRTPEYRANMSEIARAIASRPGQREKSSNAAKKRFSKPGALANLSQLGFERFSTQEAKDKSAAQHGTKPFICHQNGQTFVNQATACRVLGVSSACLSKTLRGLKSSVKGFTFSIIETAAIDG